MVLIGLGNPGKNYRYTRHNAGFMVLDTLAERLSLKWKKPFFRNYAFIKGVYMEEQFLLVKPLTFMNNSGLIMDDLYGRGWIKNSEMAVICDNMDLPYGECRIKTRGSDSGHNGIKSVIQNIGNSDFIRVYIGVSRPSQGEDVVSHVLGKPDGDEFIRFQKGIDRGVEASLALINNPVQSVMNEYNRKNNQSKSN